MQVRGSNMTAKYKSPFTPRLTDAERHKRFVEMARKVDASEDPADVEVTFERVAIKIDSEVSEDCLRP